MPDRIIRHMDRATARARARLGRRGTLLALLGAIWIATGITTLIAPPSPGYLLLNIATEAQGVAWIATGMVALWCANRPSGHDALGWIALYIMAAYRVLAYGWGLVEWAITVDAGGSLRAAFGALVWVAVLIILVVCAGWPEPEDPQTGPTPEVRP